MLTVKGSSHKALWEIEIHEVFISRTVIHPADCFLEVLREKIIGLDCGSGEF